MPPLGPQGTYTFTDVMNTVKDLTHQIPTTVSQVYVSDKIQSIIWLYYPWRWTLNVVAPITAINGQQDYASVPSDFHKLTAGRILRTDISPNQIQPIKVAGHIEGEVQRQGSINTVQSVSYEPTINSFRLDIPLQVASPTVYLISLDYQQKPTKVTTLATTLAPPDQYFRAQVDGTLWGIYRLADDPRAGTVQINRAGDKEYTEALGTFMDSLETMRRDEDSGQALDTRYPEAPMGWTRMGNPGIFPSI